jgi:galactonate dehydratase
MRHMQKVRISKPLGHDCCTKSNPRRKLRCSGTLPCSLCVRSTEKCEYNAGYRRGRIPHIPVIDQDAIIGLHSPTTTPGRAALDKNVDQVLGKVRKMQAESSPPEHTSVQLDMQLIRGHETELSTGLTESVSPDVRFSLPQSHHLQASTDTPALPMTSDSPRATTSSRNSPEPDETDLEGHYVGASSGVSFLLRVQKRLHENFRISATETIFNFGDAPLPTCDPHFLVLPPIREAKVLVDRYFDFSFPTHRFLHQRTVEAWLQDFYSGVNETSNFVDRAVKAVILMVLAQGKQYLAENDGLVGESVKR